MTAMNSRPARSTKMGRTEMTSRRYPVVIEKTGTGFSAYSPDIPGCVSTGDTEEETRRNFQAALTAHFDLMREVGEQIPDRTHRSITSKWRHSPALGSRPFLN